MSKYWLICYQFYGYYDINNVVVKDEHPIDYILRKNNKKEPRTYLLVNFWEITESQYYYFSKKPLFVDM